MRVSYSFAQMLAAAAFANILLALPAAAQPAALPDGGLVPAILFLDHAGNHAAATGQLSAAGQVMWVVSAVPGGTPAAAQGYLTLKDDNHVNIEVELRWNAATTRLEWTLRNATPHQYRQFPVLRHDSGGVQARSAADKDTNGKLRLWSVQEQPKHK